MRRITHLPTAIEPSLTVCAGSPTSQAPKGRHFIPRDVINHCFVSHLRRSFVVDWLLIHALTAVAIACRPFGPKLSISQ